jgi:hypothetical protein
MYMFHYTCIYLIEAYYCREKLQVADWMEACVHATAREKESLDVKAEVKRAQLVYQLLCNSGYLSLLNLTKSGSDKAIDICGPTE